MWVRFEDHDIRIGSMSVDAQEHPAAEFKRGKVDDAIETLQRAAEKDPTQAEIQEHLGDALYTSGRRFEARFAWQAALVTGEDKIAERVKAKLASGLNPADAAP